MSRLPRSFWLGSSTSPLAITSSYFSAGSEGSKPRGDGADGAWATCIGACAWAGPARAPVAAAAVLEARKSRRDRSMGLLPSARRRAAAGDHVQEASDLDVEEIDVGREQPARGGVSGDGLRTDRDVAHVTDVARRLERLPLRVEQILLARQNQRLGLDRAQRL